MAELIGQGPVGIPGGTSVVFTTPFPLRPGSTASDTAGGKYVFCDLTGTAYAGQPVLISSDFTAAVVGTTGRGPVGIVMASGTSDNGAWVQVYGRCFAQVSYNAASPSDAANGPTTLSTSAATIFILQSTQSSPVALGYTSDNLNSSADTYFVDGITVASDASPGDVSAVTSGTTHVGAQIAVFLNYPQLKIKDNFVT
jgi:hypothetical protein